ncbi:hypothetical protein AgCh_035985 [Apium graveolens]
MENSSSSVECVKRQHKHDPAAYQCSSSVTQHIKAPVDIGDLMIGSVREVNVKSGLPATKSTEMLELLDDTKHILGVKIVGGDHRLKFQATYGKPLLAARDHFPTGADIASELHKLHHSKKLVALQQILEECGIGLEASNSEGSLNV